MRIKLEWSEFVDAAMRELARKHALKGLPEFYQHYGYEPDGQCYNFPPAYVEIEVTDDVIAGIETRDSDN